LKSLRPTFGEEWRIEGERLMQFDRDLLWASKITIFD